MKAEEHCQKELRDMVVMLLTKEELDCFPENKRYYDQGWNARCKEEEYDNMATLDWRDGWWDCNGIRKVDRVLI